MRPIFFGLIILLLGFGSSAQEPIWARIIGGIYDELPNSICADKDGNTIIAGNFYSPKIWAGKWSSVTATAGYTQPNYFLIKLNAEGFPLFARTEIAGGFEAQKVLTDSNMNIYVQLDYCEQMLNILIPNDTIQPTNTWFRSVLMKYDKDGNSKWYRTMFNHGILKLGGIMSFDLVDQNHLVAAARSEELRWDVGYTQWHWLDLLEIRCLDSTGSLHWNHYINAKDSSIMEFRDISKAPNGQFMILGKKNCDTLLLNNQFLAACTEDFFILRFDTLGNFLGLIPLPINGSGDFKRMKIDDNFNIVLYGLFTSATFQISGLPQFVNSGVAGQTRELFLVKYQSNGIPTWARTLQSSKVKWGMDLKLDTLNNIYINGVYDGTGLSLDGVYSSSGLSAFTQQISGNLNNANGFVLKFNPAGVLTDQAHSVGRAGISFHFDVPRENQLWIAGDNIPGEGLFGTLVVDSFGGSRDVFVARLDKMTGIREPVPGKSKCSVFPNPCSNIVNITLAPEEFEGPVEIRFYDLQGREKLREEIYAKGISEYSFSTEHLSSGVYAIRIISKEKTFETKLVILK